MRPTVFLPACLAGVLALAALSGCAPRRNQDDLTAYVTVTLPACRELEQQALAFYESVSGDNYQDDAALFDALRLQVVPLFTELIEKAEGARPATDEVRHLHEGYVSVLRKELSAFQEYVSALDQQDAEGVARAIEQQNESVRLLRNFERRLKEFCNERGVVLPESDQAPSGA